MREMRRLPVTVMSMKPTDDGRFCVHVQGGLEYWTIDQIKQAVAEGAYLRQREES